MVIYSAQSIATEDNWMRGEDRLQAGMFSYILPEQRVPQDHPLRAVRVHDGLGAESPVAEVPGALCAARAPLDPAGEAPPGAASAGALHGLGETRETLT